MSGIDPDARSHRRGDGEALDVAALRPRGLRAEQLVDHGDIRIQVSRLAEGDDPAVNVVKTLVIDYTVGDRKGSVTGRDSDTVTLTADNHTIVVKKATYGVPNDAKRSRDVKQKLQDMIDKGMREFQVAHRAEATLSLFRTPQQGRYGGINVGKAGEIRSFGTGARGGLANGGVYLMEATLIEGGPWRPESAVSLEEDILPFAVQAGKRVYGMECAGRFLDIGVPEDYARAAQVLGA